MPTKLIIRSLAGSKILETIGLVTGMSRVWFLTPAVSDPKIYGKIGFFYINKDMLYLISIELSILRGISLRSTS